jgi:hypothetical protein
VVVHIISLTYSECNCVGVRRSYEAFANVEQYSTYIVAAPKALCGRDVYATHLSLTFVLLLINYLFTIDICINLIQHTGKKGGTNILSPCRIA